MSESDRNERNKRAGLHPAFVIFGIIAGLWIFVQAIIPTSRHTHPPQGHEAQSGHTATLLREARSAPVPPLTVTASLEESHAVSLLVPAQTTDSQIVALLHSLRESSTNHSLSSHLPATTPGHTLGDHAVADIYIFSDPEYAVAEAIHILSRGARTPGDFYQSAMPYEHAMEHVRGHYTINLHDRRRPERASLGFGEDATGLYSKRYLPLF